MHRNRQAAQAVVASEFNNNNLRMKGEHVFQAVHSVFGCIAVDAFVDDVIGVAAAVEVAL